MRMREFKISGYLVGTIWMPAAECYKPIDYKFVREELDKANPWVDVHETLRDAMLHVTNDGDFQSCAVADGTLTIRDVIYSDDKGARVKTIARQWDMSCFPSVADMVKTDWAGPSDNE